MFGIQHRMRFPDPLSAWPPGMNGYLLRVLLNSKITYRPHCPGTGGGAFNISNF